MKQLAGTDVFHILRDRDLPDAGEGACCEGAALLGPGGCTCWDREYDVAQEPPDTTAVPVTRVLMCGDCAFRPDSPERTGESAAAYDQDDLEALVHGSQGFWCHQGMRLIVGQRHPAGVFKPQPEGEKLAYDPPIINGVPYKADGSPGERCAGLAARRRAVNGGEL
jgi:hypothetical protein